jgi:RNA recognition motif-containing protein
MQFKAYVGNIPFDVSEDDIREFFGDLQLKDVKIILDRETKRPRGFAFVEFENAEDLENAIENLDQVEMDGRKIVVSLANEKKSGGKGGGKGGRNGDRQEKQRDDDYQKEWQHRDD